MMAPARALSIAFRTAHLAAFGLLLGGHAFGVDAPRLLPWLWLTVLSGLGLIAVEVHGAGLHWFVLGKGLAVLAKLGILLAVPLFWEQRFILLLIVVVIASVGSHMPARYRHYSLFHRRVIERDAPPCLGGLHRRPQAAGSAVVRGRRPEASGRGRDYD